MPGPYPDALVTTAWLAEHLNDPAVRIVDASYFVPGGVTPAKERYAAGHIPGAVFFDINDIADMSKAKEHAFPTAAIFASKVGALGIGNNHYVVAYDHMGGACAAARAWFMFRTFGHSSVAVLDGGLTKWAAENRPLSKDTPRFPKAVFTGGESGNRIRSKADILENISRSDYQLLDARSKGRFEGVEPEPRAGLRSGHIPKSRSLPSALLFDGATKTWKDTQALKDAFAAAGIALDKPLTTTCGSGVTACTLALGAYLTGKTDTAIYDGSWVEWGADPALPLEAGPPQ